MCIHKQRNHQPRTTSKHLTNAITTKAKHSTYKSNRLAVILTRLLNKLFTRLVTVCLGTICEGFYYIYIANCLQYRMEYNTENQQITSRQKDHNPQITLHNIYRNTSALYQTTNILHYTPATTTHIPLLHSRINSPFRALARRVYL